LRGCWLWDPTFFEINITALTLFFSRHNGRLILAPAKEKDIVRQRKWKVATFISSVLISDNGFALYQCH